MPREISVPDVIDEHLQQLRAEAGEDNGPEDFMHTERIFFEFKYVLIIYPCLYFRKLFIGEKIA